ncbi:MAG: MFS transporter [Tannerellaceae bacterium]|nr:MFS transporter [Tannerellaceae bacterium]
MVCSSVYTYRNADEPDRQEKTVLFALLTGTAGMLVPFISYTFPAVAVAFALLGISNTILQVSLNPLVASVVSGDKLAGTLSLGQLIKAICSFLAPLLSGFTAVYLNDWKLIFLIYAIVSILTFVWLYLTPIQTRQEVETNRVTFKRTFALLGTSYIFQLFLGILLIVGIDVCMNIYSPQLLLERLQIDIEYANLGVSLYFGARMIGAFTGSILLMKYNPARFMRLNMVFALIACTLLIFFADPWILFAALFAIGFTCTNVFSILFSFALQYNENDSDALSSLMIVGVAGGAVITPVMGFLSSQWGIASGFGLLLLCIFYIFTLSFKSSNS